MDNVKTHASIANLVTERHSRAHVFESLGIDFCCGGKKSLEEVCAEKRLDLQLVINELKKSDQESDTRKEGNEKDWSKCSITELADHIEQTHHVFLREKLPFLEKLADKVAKVHGDRQPSLSALSALFHSFKQNLDMHSMKEEQILFPMLKSLDKSHTRPSFHCGSIRNPIVVMGFEHDDAGACLKKFREFTNDYSIPDWACNSYRTLMEGLKELEQDLHIHVHKENHILFPKAQETEANLPLG
jgi:regulator of cell morphogenesis and NO signaling